MKKRSKVISTLVLSALITTMSSKFFVVEGKDKIAKEVLSGSSSYETAIKISEEWKKADNIILVNSAPIADALSAAPFAKFKDAPILLTESDKLTKATSKRIKELGAKNVFIIGGEGVVSEKVLKEVESLGVKAERISGKDRYETSLKIAEKLDFKKVAVVNGTKGLADAVSVAAPAATNNLAIVLTDGVNLGEAEKIVSNKEVFVIGGEGVVSEALSKKLKAERIGGKDRNETNVKIMDRFYQGKELESLYIAKGDYSKEEELIDALVAGALAGKKGAPIMIVGDELSQSQKDYVKSKGKVKNIYGIGGEIKENIFNNIAELIDVKTTEEKNNESTSKSTGSTGGSTSSSGSTGNNGGSTKPTEPTKPEGETEVINTGKFINKDKSSIMEVHFVYYGIITLNEGNIDNYEFYVEGEKATPQKVNTEGTIVKIELKDSSNKEIKVKKDSTEDKVTLKLKM